MSDSEEIDSDLEDRLYAQLHHEQNPLFIEDFSEIELKTKLNLPNVVQKHEVSKILETNPKNESHLKKKILKRAIDQVDNSDVTESKYYLQKKESRNHSQKTVKESCPEPEEVMIIDELTLSNDKSSKNGSRRNFGKSRHSSESSDDVIFLKDLKTDVSINIKNVKGKQIDDEHQEFSVAALQKSMSDSSWDLSFKDRYGHVRESSRYYGNGMKNVKCNNCNERGHLSKVCTKPRKTPVCYLCGNQGHYATRCKNIICSICFARGHLAEHCNVCNMNVKCTHCFFFGHTSQNCPDIWRKYHLTIEEGPLVRSNPLWNRNIQCYNCCSKKHYGYECKAHRMNRYQYCSYPGIISYEDVIFYADDEPLNFQHADADHSNNNVIADNKNQKKKSRLKKMKEFFNFPRRKLKKEKMTTENCTEDMNSFLGPKLKKNKRRQGRRIRNRIKTKKKVNVA